ncbi:MORN repeat-containing protein [Flagellimonas sp.]|uniref:MORN repeat-containing protein n=1 Tax=Flagellimonas sp. TaxID=2058762 RepID=UPI003BABF8B8
MKIKKYTPFVLLAIFAAGLFFFIAKSVQLQKSLAQVKSENTIILKKINTYEQLSKIDSLLLQGDYDTAIESYNASIDSGEENNMLIPLRIALAEKLMQNSAATNPMPDSIMAEQDSLPKSSWSEEVAIRKYDSINFSLEKAKVQLTRLKKQLQQKSFGEYLTFKSKKGNQMHYIGQVKDGQAHGFGVALLDTGSRYEGEWKNNQRHGDGTFYWSDGEYYVGNYKNDKRSGLGTYYWPNGEKYTGEWKDDKRSGSGNFYDAEGEVVAGGEWNDDKLVEVNER